MATLSSRHIKLYGVVAHDCVFRIGAVPTVLSDTVELRPCMYQATLSTDIHVQQTPHKLFLT